MKFNADFDKECRRRGYDGMEEFENSVVQDLYKYKKVHFMCSIGPAWVRNSLKKYYDIETYMSEPAVGNIYTLSIDYRKSNFVDENTLNNYFI